MASVPGSSMNSTNLVSDSTKTDVDQVEFFASYTGKWVGECDKSEGSVQTCSADRKLASSRDAFDCLC